MRVTAKPEGIDEAQPEGVYEIVPMRDRRNARLFCRKPVCKLNKQSASLNLDVGECVEQKRVIEVETLRHQQNMFPGIRKKLIYI